MLSNEHLPWNKFLKFQFPVLGTNSKFKNPPSNSFRKESCSARNKIHRKFFVCIVYPPPLLLNIYVCLAWHSYFNPCCMIFLLQSLCWFAFSESKPCLSFSLKYLHTKNFFFFLNADSRFAPLCIFLADFFTQTDFTQITSDITYNHSPNNIFFKTQGW